jgi:hypothetical protein
VAVGNQVPGPSAPDDAQTQKTYLHDIYSSCFCTETYDAAIAGGFPFSHRPMPAERDGRSHSQDK